MKSGEFTEMAIDMALFRDMAQILADYFRGKFTYKVDTYVGVNGELERQAWVASGDGWNLEVSTLASDKPDSEDKRYVFIIADPKGKREVWSLARLLAAHNARWTQGINPQMPCPK